MTFEEFFKKKKINLVTLEQGEPALFSEFKIHFEKMGEKSFDHTKKYWFNKLRLRFPAPTEAKIEKVVMENPLAEQTINETLSETSAPPVANVGFKPRFKAGMAKPTEATPNAEQKAPEAQKPTEASESSAPVPAVGFKPRFKAGVTKPAEAEQEKPSESTEQSTPSLGFKPKFKAGVTKSIDPSTNQKEEPKADEPAPTPEKSEPSAPAPNNIGFRPRFNAKNMKPKPPEE